MKQRGRRSAASQGMENVVKLVDVGQQKPEPPEFLTAEQRQVWRDIVTSMRAGSFYPATFPLLECYCRAVVTARFIEGLLRKCDYKSEPKQYRALLQMQSAQSATLSMLATKLRLLPRANTRKERHETDASGTPWNIRRARPWEDEPDDDAPEPAA